MRGMYVCVCISVYVCVHVWGSTAPEKAQISGRKRSWIMTAASSEARAVLMERFSSKGKKNKI